MERGNPTEESQHIPPVEFIDDGVKDVVDKRFNITIPILPAIVTMSIATQRLSPSIVTNKIATKRFGRDVSTMQIMNKYIEDNIYIDYIAILERVDTFKEDLNQIDNQ